MGLPGATGRANGELLFDGYRVSVLQVLKVCCTKIYLIYLILMNRAYKNSSSGKFYGMWLFKTTIKN